MAAEATEVAVKAAGRGALEGATFFRGPAVINVAFVEVPGIRTKQGSMAGMNICGSVQVLLL